MTSVAVAIDRIRSSSQDLADLNKFVSALNSHGYSAKAVGRGPNHIQQYMLSSSHSCDVMIQIAGGLCTGTLGDFIAGIKRGYYHAKKGAIVYNMVANNLNPVTWKAVKAHDWGGLSMSVVTPYVGKTLPQIYSENKDVLTKFAWGKTIDALIKMYLDGSEGTSEGAGKVAQGNSILELIKQVMSDNDHLGVDMDLHGDTLSIKRTQPSSGLPLGENRIINNSVTFTDYDPQTPNTFNSAKDKYLVDRFGEVPIEASQEVAKIDEAQVLQVAERGHGHSIELKCVIGADYVAGKWVQLNLPSLGISNRPYFISKYSYDEDLTPTLTLEPAPPSIYVEAPAEVEEEENTEGEEGESTTETDDA